MADTREIAYENALEAGFVPDYLEQWMDHCHCLEAEDLPDYAYLGRLLESSAPGRRVPVGERSPGVPAQGCLGHRQPGASVLAAEE